MAKNREVELLAFPILCDLQIAVFLRPINKRFFEISVDFRAYLMNMYVAEFVKRVPLIVLLFTTRFVLKLLVVYTSLLSLNLRFLGFVLIID